MTTVQNCDHVKIDSDCYTKSYTSRTAVRVKSVQECGILTTRSRKPRALHKRRARGFRSHLFVVTRYEFNRSRLDELPLCTTRLGIRGTLSLVRLFDQPMRLSHCFLKLPAQSHSKPQRMVSRIHSLSAMQASEKRMSGEFFRLQQAWISAKSTLISATAPRVVRGHSGVPSCPKGAAGYWATADLDKNDR